MSDTPGEFYDIGKKARDLLHKDYAHQPRPPIHFDHRSLKTNTDISCKVKDIVPGLSTLFSFSMPNSGKVELEYLNEDMIQLQTFRVDIHKFNAGLSLNSPFVIAALSLDRLDTFKASCYYMANPLTQTAIAAELKHSFSINDTAFAIGAQQELFPSTLVKGRISTHGKVAALIQQGLWEKIFLSISGEVDFTDTREITTPKIGLSLAVRLQMNII
ncbi:hypothetical protein M0R45_023214 [Rubus argutus]|uniref:Uncharacterized protein n=1 Tax=Rubus argutus TaxID=59490 RepID=A0AAW1WMU5_RUBAR